MPALYHQAIEEAVLDWGLNQRPPALDASTLPLGYRGGGLMNMFCIIKYLNTSMYLPKQLTVIVQFNKHKNNANYKQDTQKHELLYIWRHTKTKAWKTRENYRGKNKIKITQNTTKTLIDE